MKQLHLAQVHRSLGAEFIPFAGWEMPIKYTSVAEEHLAVRNAVGLFDVSHMGEFSVEGEGAIEFLQQVTSNDISKLKIGSAHYTTVLNERGGTKDDGVVYRLDEKKFMFVCNSINVEKIGAWLTQHAGKEVEVEDVTMSTILLALQGPRAQEVLQQLTGFELPQLKRFKAAITEVAGAQVILSRTGYTGEDGFELYITDEPASNPTRGKKLYDALMQAGERFGIKPCGLGARDTTRLEAGMCLYGHELTEQITPLEARIGFVVKFEKGEFIGRESLLEQKAAGLKRARVGLRMLEAGVPREGYKLLKDDREVGVVSSGTFSPLLKVGIAMGYATPELKPGERISMDIRGKPRSAEVVSWPFYDSERYGHLRR